MNFVLLDFDGTISDTETYWLGRKSAFLQERFGISERKSKSFANQFAGKSLQEFAYKAHEHFKVKNYDYNQVESQIDNDPDFCLSVKSINGAIAYMKYCHTNNLRLAICTNSPEKYVFDFLNANYVINIVDKVFSTYGTGRSKPLPDIYIEANNYVRQRGGRILHTIEDSSSGVESASMAGIKCIWLGRTNQLPLFNNVEYAEDYSEIQRITHDQIHCFA